MTKHDTDSVPLISLESESREEKGSVYNDPLLKQHPSKYEDICAEKNVNSCVSSQVITPLIVGEVVVDELHDGHTEIGGTPFHIAWHLKGFGYSPLLISRIGNDQNGERILDTMRDWNMESKGIQIDYQFPTGKAKKIVNNGRQLFLIDPNQAFDYLLANQALSAIEGVVNPILFHTLTIQRAPLSRDTLDVLRLLYPDKIFFDIGINATPIECGHIQDSIKKSHFIKLDHYGIQWVGNNYCKSVQDPYSVAAKTCVINNIHSVFGFHDRDQIFLLNKLGELYEKKQIKDVDRIDRCRIENAQTAVVFIGLMNHWSSDLILERALDFSKNISSLDSYLPNDNSCYERYRKKWMIL